MLRFAGSSVLTIITTVQYPAFHLSSSVYAVFFKTFSLLLFIFTFISLLPLYNYLFKLFWETILLFVLKHAVHTFFAINL